MTLLATRLAVRSSVVNNATPGGARRSVTSSLVSLRITLRNHAAYDNSSPKQLQLAAKGFGEDGGHEGIKFEGRFTFYMRYFRNAPPNFAEFALDLH